MEWTGIFGAAAPPVLLVHGWCCDHTYFAPQIEHFASQGHRAVAVDLRGHGRSDKPHQSYPMQAFADNLAWMCEQLELAKPMVVGHSMGGIVLPSDVPRGPVQKDSWLGAFLPVGSAGASQRHDRALPRYHTARLIPPVDYRIATRPCRCLPASSGALVRLFTPPMNKCSNLSNPMTDHLPWAHCTRRRVPGTLR
jgi:pimeloyl-ACP methyl ester carboxylesterase